MGVFKIGEKELNHLYDLADAQHPHLKGDNHTRDLINKVYNHVPLTIEEAFDCGKYYDRMLKQISKGDFGDDYLHSVLSFKWCVK